MITANQFTPSFGGAIQELNLEEINLVFGGKATDWGAVITGGLEGAFQGSMVGAAGGAVAGAIAGATAGGIGAVPGAVGGAFFGAAGGALGGLIDGGMNSYRSQNGGRIFTLEDNKPKLKSL